MRTDTVKKNFLCFEYARAGEIAVFRVFGVDVWRRLGSMWGIGLGERALFVKR